MSPRTLVVVPRTTRNVWDKICGTRWFDVYEGVYEGERKLLNTFPSRSSAQYWTDELKQSEDVKVIFADEESNEDNEETEIVQTLETDVQAEKIRNKLNEMNSLW